MELKYMQDCPSCGAPVELDEADRIIACPFCDGRNYMILTKPLRFVLPHMIPREIPPDDILFLPYLRFKGHVFSCQGREVKYKIVDTTQLGFSHLNLPVSLGLRPQAMKIRPLAFGHPGKFVKLTEKVRNIFVKAARLSEAFSEMSGELYHRSYIGETVSFIYLPLYFRENTLMDGVLNRPVTEKCPREVLESHCLTVRQEWMPQFITTLCPNCADVLTGEKCSLVLACTNCDSLWQEERGRFVRIKWKALPGQQNSNYLPFWRLTMRNAGLQLNSFADFLRLTNHPVVIKEQHETLELQFWLPAFKIRPRFFLSISKNLTLSQLKLPKGDIFIPGKLYPATLLLQEAVQAVKSVVAASVLDKKRFMPQLPDFTSALRSPELVYLPFDRKGVDYVQNHTGVSINASSLHYGKSM